MIDPLELFRVFEKHRGDAIVMASGQSGQHWKDVSTNPKRDAAIGGAMGCPAPLALGLALSQPDVKVVLFDSEGSLLMNLGVLATIADQKPSNFYHILLDNECYATTGGQPVPSAADVSYHGMAKDAGYAAAHSFDDLEEFAINIEGILDRPGPVFVSMKIVPEIENLPIDLRPVVKRRSREEVIKDLRDDFGIAAG
jgi:sulfopyruvate decarboxylase subunit beta